MAPQVRGFLEAATYQEGEDDVWVDDDVGFQAQHLGVRLSGELGCVPPEGEVPRDRAGAIEVAL
jgi:hypothetical protein